MKPKIPHSYLLEPTAEKIKVEEPAENPQPKQEKTLQEKWEDKLDRKILTHQEYESLVKKSNSLAFKIITMILAVMLFAGAVWYTNETIRSKDFSFNNNITSNTPVTVNTPAITCSQVSVSCGNTTVAPAVCYCNNNTV